MNNKVLLVLIVLLITASFLAGSFYTKIQYLEKGTKSAVQPTPAPQAAAQPTPVVLGTSIGNFVITKDELCKEDGKPVVYFFGGSFCPHCKWEHPIVEKVMEKFKDQVSFHNNMDKQDADKEIWNKYASINQGGVPFIVLGCRYARVGSGETLGEKEEERILTALVCKLTGGQPEKTCQGVADLLGKIE